MRNRLWLLNVALVALLGYIGLRFFEVRDAARDREAKVLRQTVEPKTYPALAPIPAIAGVTAASYADVALRTLMSKDRNPNVLIEPEPIAPKPVMPPLPTVQGVMTIGEPTIIMSDRGVAGQRSYRVGEKVGPFKLVAFTNDDVTLEWNGEKVTRKLDELVEKGASVSGAAVAQGGTATPAATEQGPQPEDRGPGGAIGGGYRGCLANDSSPAGTVRDGVRKVEIMGPMGKSCRWEPVK